MNDRKVEIVDTQIVIEAEEAPTIRGEDYKLEEKPSWTNRRRVIFGTLIFCGLCVGYLLFKGEDSKVAETAITMSFFLAGSVIGGYVFGATWQDVGMHRNRNR